MTTEEPITLATWNRGNTPPMPPWLGGLPERFPIPTFASTPVIQTTTPPLINAGWAQPPAKVRG